MDENLHNDQHQASTQSQSQSPSNDLSGLAAKHDATKVEKNQSKTKSKLKQLVFLPICIAVVVFLLFVVVLQIFFPASVIEIFGVQAYMVSYTKSMEPTLNYNDLIWVKKFDFDKLKEGDIITFYAQTTEGKTIVITHQIIEIYYEPATDQTLITTKGINKSQRDFVPVSRDGALDTNKYIGKYVAKSEFLGNLFAYISSPAGLTALAINTALIVAFQFLLKKTKPPKKTY